MSRVSNDVPRAFEDNGVFRAMEAEAEVPAVESPPPEEETVEVPAVEEETVEVPAVEEETEEVLEMKEQPTATVTEIVEGDEGGGESDPLGAAEGWVVAEKPEGSNGEVAVSLLAQMGQRTRSAPVRKRFNKFLFALVAFMVICIIFLAIAWPRERKAEETTREEALSGERDPRSENVSTEATEPATSLPPTVPPMDQDNSSKLPSDGTSENYNSDACAELDAQCNNNGSNTEASTLNNTSMENVSNKSEDAFSIGEGGVFITTVENTSENTSFGEETLNMDTELIANSTSNMNMSGKLQAKRESSPSRKKEERKCMSSVCQSLSANMLALMNHTADPCKDFYMYACGGIRAEGSQWIGEIDSVSEIWSRISDTMVQSNNSSPMAIKKFKHFYESCVSYDKTVTMETRIEKARSILQNIGKLYTAKDWENSVSTDDFTILLGNLLSHHFSPFLDLLLDVDSHDNTKFALKLTLPLHPSPFGDSIGDDSQATLHGWPRESCKKVMPKKGLEEHLDTKYKDYAKCNDDINEYVGEIKTALKELKIIENSTDLQRIFTELEWDVLKKIKEIIPKTTEKNRIIAEKEFQEYTLEDLQDEFNYVDWNNLTYQLINDTLPGNTTVQVYFKSYFKDLFNKTSVMDGRSLNNALVAIFAHELYHGLVLNRNSCSRESYCLVVAGNLMGDAASALFLKSFPQEQLSDFQKKINSTFYELISTLASEISLKWENGSLHSEEALKMVQTIRLIDDGGVPMFLNEKFLNEQFKEYRETSTYLENAVVLLQRYRKKMYLSYNKNPSDSEQIWFHFLDPLGNKGHAIPALNSIVVPYGTMQRPFVSQYYPPHFKMGRLGQQIAKEIWLLLSKTGIQYIPGRINEKFLKSMPKTSVSNVFKCLLTDLSFDKFATIPDGTALINKLNSSVYMHDLLADSVAVYLAYNSAWENEENETEMLLPWLSLTPKQQFFLFMTQSVCTKSSIYHYTVSIFEDLQLPPFIKVNYIARNSHELREAFSCPPINHTMACTSATATASHSGSSDENDRGTSIEL